MGAVADLEWLERGSTSITCDSSYIENGPDSFCTMDAQNCTTMMNRNTALAGKVPQPFDISTLNVNVPGLSSHMGSGGHDITTPPSGAPALPVIHDNVVDLNSNQFAQLALPGFPEPLLEPQCLSETSGGVFSIPEKQPVEVMLAGDTPVEEVQKMAESFRIQSPVSPIASSRPSVAPSASSRPSVAPSASSRPSVAPSASSRPSVAPSASSRPSVAPSASSRPSVAPSASSRPSVAPSERNWSSVEVNARIEQPPLSVNGVHAETAGSVNTHTRLSSLTKNQPASVNQQLVGFPPIATTIQLNDLACVTNHKMTAPVVWPQFTTNQSATQQCFPSGRVPSQQGRRKQTFSVFGTEEVEKERTDFHAASRYYYMQYMDNLEKMNNLQRKRKEVQIQTTNLNNQSKGKQVKSKGKMKEKKGAKSNRGRKTRNLVEIDDDNVAGMEMLLITYQCGMCEQEYSNTEDLEAHMVTHQENVGKAGEGDICSVPDVRDTPKSDFALKHKSINKTTGDFEKQGDKVEPDKSITALTTAVAAKYSCASCPLKFEVEKDLLAHEVIHIETLNFSALKDVPENINIPVTIDTNMVKRYLCDSCPEVFETEKHLLAHAVIHRETSDISSLKVIPQNNRNKHSVWSKTAHEAAGFDGSEWNGFHSKESQSEMQPGGAFVREWLVKGDTSTSVTNASPHVSNVTSDIYSPETSTGSPEIYTDNAEANADNVDTYLDNVGENTDIVETFDNARANTDTVETNAEEAQTHLCAYCSTVYSTEADLVAHLAVHRERSESNSVWKFDRSEVEWQRNLPNVPKKAKQDLSKVLRMNTAKVKRKCLRESRVNARIMEILRKAKAEMERERKKETCIAVRSRDRTEAGNQKSSSHQRNSCNPLNKDPVGPGGQVIGRNNDESDGRGDRSTNAGSVRQGSLGKSRTVGASGRNARNSAQMGDVRQHSPATTPAHSAAVRHTSGQIGSVDGATSSLRTPAPVAVRHTIPGSNGSFGQTSNDTNSSIEQTSYGTNSPVGHSSNDTNSSVRHISPGRNNHVGHTSVGELTSSTRRPAQMATDGHTSHGKPSNVDELVGKTAISTHTNVSTNDSDGDSDVEIIEQPIELIIIDDSESENDDSPEYDVAEDEGSLENCANETASSGSEDVVSGGTKTVSNVSNISVQIVRSDKTECQRPLAEDQNIEQLATTSDRSLSLFNDNGDDDDDNGDNDCDAGKSEENQESLNTELYVQDNVIEPKTCGTQDETDAAPISSLLEVPNQDVNENNKSPSNKRPLNLDPEPPTSWKKRKMYCSTPLDKHLTAKYNLKQPKIVLRQLTVDEIALVQSHRPSSKRDTMLEDDLQAESESSDDEEPNFSVNDCLMNAESPSSFLNSTVEKEAISRSGNSILPDVQQCVEHTTKDNRVQQCVEHTTKDNGVQQCVEHTTKDNRVQQCVEHTTKDNRVQQCVEHRTQDNRETDLDSSLRVKYGIIDSKVVLKTKAVQKYANKETLEASCDQTEYLLIKKYGISKSAVSLEKLENIDVQNPMFVSNKAEKISTLTGSTTQDESDEESEPTIYAKTRSSVFNLKPNNTRSKTKHFYGKMQLSGGVDKCKPKKNLNKMKQSPQREMKHSPQREMKQSPQRVSWQKRLRAKWRKSRTCIVHAKRKYRIWDQHSNTAKWITRTRSSLNSKTVNSKHLEKPNASLKKDCLKFKNTNVQLNLKQKSTKKFGNRKKRQLKLSLESKSQRANVSEKMKFASLVKKRLHQKNKAKLKRLKQIQDRKKQPKNKPMVCIKKATVGRKCKFRNDSQITIISKKTVNTKTKYVSGSLKGLKKEWIEFLQCNPVPKVVLPRLTASDIDDFVKKGMDTACLGAAHAKAFKLSSRIVKKYSDIIENTQRLCLKVARLTEPDIVRYTVRDRESEIDTSRSQMRPESVIARDQVKQIIEQLVDNVCTIAESVTEEENKSLKEDRESEIDTSRSQMRPESVIVRDQVKQIIEQLVDNVCTVAESVTEEENKSLKDRMFLSCSGESKLFLKPDGTTSEDTCSYGAELDAYGECFDDEETISHSVDGSLDTNVCSDREKAKTSCDFSAINELGIIDNESGHEEEEMVNLVVYAIDYKGGAGTDDDNVQKIDGDIEDAETGFDDEIQNHMPTSQHTPSQYGEHDIISNQRSIRGADFDSETNIGAIVCASGDKQFYHIPNTDGRLPRNLVDTPLIHNENTFDSSSTTGMSDEQDDFNKLETLAEKEGGYQGDVEDLDDKDSASPQM